MKFPFPDIRLRPREAPSPDRLAELFNALQENQDFIARAALFLVRGDLDLEVNVGSDTCTWPGGAEISNTKTIVHGLEGTPKLLLTGTPTSAGKLSLPYYFTPTETEFSVRCYSPFKPAAGETSEFDWVALG